MDTGEGMEAGFAGHHLEDRLEGRLSTTMGTTDTTTTEDSEVGLAGVDLEEDTITMGGIIEGGMSVEGKEKESNASNNLPHKDEMNTFERAVFESASQMEVFNNNNFTGTFLDPQSAKTGLALCLTAYAVYGAFALAFCFFRPDARNKSTDFFITARNSQSTMWSACSWFASAMGAWTITGPASLVADPNYGSGLVGLFVYAIFTGAPLVMLAYFGSGVRDNVPQATSVSSYARWRFGIVAQVFVLLVVLLSLTISLLTEYQTIAGIFVTFFGCSPYIPLVMVGTITMMYTSAGGLYVSIITDCFQTVVVWILTIGTCIYLGISFKDQKQGLGPLPAYLGATAAGWETFATLMIPFICGTFYSEAFWQRIWSANGNKSLKHGAIIGGTMASLVIFVLGFGAVLAYWSGRALPESNSSYAFFYAFANEDTGDISPVVAIVVLLFATIMNEGAVDSMQNAITDALTTTCIGLFQVEVKPIYVRVLVLVANIPIMAGASYLQSSGVSILNAFGTSNMLTTITFCPLAAGLIPQLNDYLTTYSALGACLCSFFSVMVYGYLSYGTVYLGMTAMWWSPNYDYLGFITAFVSSIVFLPVCIAVEMGVRKACGLDMPKFSPAVVSKVDDSIVVAFVEDVKASAADEKSA
ncbi:hypothetical protein HDU98_003906 [Podochytrium sp. JEL0797]|nr:hypothetical protein HDU98_003906 [Podochytrium sp. JEL0797]